MPVNCGQIRNADQCFGISPEPSVALRPTGSGTITGWPGVVQPGMDQAFLGSAADIFKGPIRVGQDGDFISLPAGSTQIDVSRRF